MKIAKKCGLSACLLTLLAPIVLAGCGGGGSAAGGSTANTAQGSLVFRVTFPTVTRTAGSKISRASGPGTQSPTTIPMGAHSVKISLIEPTSGRPYAADRVVNDTVRPDGVTGSISVAYAALPVGPVRVDVVACPDLNAAGNPLATGSTTGAITAMQTTTVSVPMALTIKSLTLTPATQTVHIFQQVVPPVTVTAQALNASGMPLLYPLTYAVDKTQAASILSVAPDFQSAQIGMFMQPTTVTVTVTEPNSGMTAQVQVILAYP